MEHDSLEQPNNCPPERERAHRTVSQRRVGANEASNRNGISDAACAAVASSRKMDLADVDSAAAR